MSREMPYFMENEDWYTTPEQEGLDAEYFPDGRPWHLTPEAPEKAVKSYEEYYAPIEFLDENGNSLVPEGWRAAW